MSIKRQNFSTVSCSKRKIEAKLKKIYRNIKGTSKEIAGVEMLLKQLAQYDIGQRTIIRMPENVKIEVDEEGYLQTENAGALYYPEEKLILIPNKFEKEQLIPLAHEMRHAIQDADGRLDVKSPFPSDRHVQEKMSEIETKLQDIIFKIQINQEPNKEKSAACLFYEAELKRYLNFGLLQEDAEKAARTSIVQIYWSGLYEQPDGCSLITENLRDDVNRWNNIYDRSAINANQKFAQKTGKFNLKKAKKLEQEQLMAERNWNKILQKDRNNALIPAYLKEMDINLTEIWFTGVQRQRSTVGDNFIVSYYPSGKIKSACFLIPNGQVFREYSEPSFKYPKAVVLHEVYYNQYEQKEGVEIYRYPNGRLKSETPYRKGEENGVKKEYHEDGTLRYITPYKKGLKDGVQKYYENGKLELETPYKEGRMDGVQKYYKDGDLKQETPYKDGKIEGIQKYYYENNILKEEVPYKNEEINGIRKCYYENGRGIELETQYKNGKIDGVQRYYREDGSVELEIWYKDGKKDGIQTEYDKEGNIIKQILYKNGKKIEFPCNWQSSKIEDVHSKKIVLTKIAQHDESL